MDLQTYIQNAVKASRANTLSNSDQLTLGELILKNLKNQIIEEFDKPDYVFIDSRTGITETGGVCTRYLADMLVILTSLNEQNISGTSHVYKELKLENKINILVASNVPVGMPTGNDQLMQERLNSFLNKLNSLPDLLIYYYPSLSLKEGLPALLNHNIVENFGKP